MISDYFTIALRNLRKRKLRSWLTMLGILISIATIFVLISLSLGLQDAVEEQFRLLGGDKIFVQPEGQIAGPGTGGVIILTEKDIETIERVNGVKDTAFWIINPSKIKFNNEIRFVNVVGFDLEDSKLFIETGSYKAEEGRLLKKEDKGVVMIGSQYKHNNFFKKPVRVGDRIEINEKEFSVKGILKPVGNPPDDQLIYMSEDDFRELFDEQEKIDFVVVQIEENENIKEIAENIERKLQKSRDVTEKTQDFIILTPEELLETFGVVLNIITGFLGGIALISLIVGGIGITNTMYTSVLERTKEIGTMKAIGAQNKDILMIFLIESGLLGLIGGVIGIILGLGIVKGIEFIAFQQLGTRLLQAATPVYLFVGCLAFAFLTGAISGGIPAWQASKTNTVDALRYE